MSPAGFTLLELLVVIAIIGIASAIAITSYLSWAQRTRADAAAVEVSRIFSQAKGRVRTTNRDVVLTFDSTAKSITLAQGGTVYSTRPLDVSSLAVTCRPTCGANAVTFAAPFAALSQDVKATITAGGYVRDAYLLGPTALYKMVRR